MRSSHCCSRGAKPDPDRRLPRRQCMSALSAGTADGGIGRAPCVRCRVPPGQLPGDQRAQLPRTRETRLACGHADRPGFSGPRPTPRACTKPSAHVPSSGLPGWRARLRGPGGRRGRPEARAPSRLPKLGMKQSRPVRSKRRATAPSTGMTSRSPPPPARALWCASASTLSPAESQDRVRVMSTTTGACLSVSSRATRSCSAVVTSISGDADTMVTPLIKGYLMPDSCAHLSRGKRDLAPGNGWVCGRTSSQPGPPGRLSRQPLNRLYCL